MHQPNHILAIEVSNPGAVGASVPPGSGPGVALGRMLDGGAVDVLGVEAVRQSSRGGHDDDLMPAIDRLCRRCGVEPRSRSLARVAVSVGPGGYTSVRVACAAGKMIAEATGARCVGVPSDRVALESLAAADRAGVVAVALAGKNDSTWVRVFDDATERGPGRLMTATDVPALAAAGLRTIIADRFLPAPMRSAAIGAGIAIREPVFDSAACLRLGARLPALDPSELVPIYPREPDAVTLWRARKGAS